MKVAFTTLGCKVNQYDTQAMRELFLAAGHEEAPFDSVADAYIINTCTVTATSDSKARQLISRARRTNPDAVIAVVGCYAQRAAEEVLAIPGVTLVAGTGNRRAIVSLVENAREGKAANAVGDISDESCYEPTEAEANEGRTRALIKIQEGCANFCTYCIIPHVRGQVRSRSVESIAREAERLAAAGYREVVLTGIHLASYGLDTGGKLTDAIEAAGRAEGITRIRLGSLEPGLLTEEFCRFAANTPKLCPHFHVSLQSGSATVLARMGRRYTPEEYMDNIERVRKYIPGAAITTDVMVGFPQETDEEFAESYKFVKKAAFSRIHVFAYSPRPGTPAAKMPGQVSAKVKKERSREMIALGEELRRSFEAEHDGLRAEVLFEKKREDGCCEGYARDYALVLAKDVAEGEIRNVVLKFDGEKLVAGD